MKKTILTFFVIATITLPAFWAFNPHGEAVPQHEAVALMILGLLDGALVWGLIIGLINESSP